MSSPLLYSYILPTLSFAQSKKQEEKMQSQLIYPNTLTLPVSTVHETVCTPCCFASSTVHETVHPAASPLCLPVARRNEQCSMRVSAQYAYTREVSTGDSAAAAASGSTASASSVAVVASAFFFSSLAQRLLWPKPPMTIDAVAKRTSISPVLHCIGCEKNCSVGTR